MPAIARNGEESLTRPRPTLGSRAKNDDEDLIRIVKDIYIEWLDQILVKKSRFYIVMLTAPLRNSEKSEMLTCITIFKLIKKEL